MVKSSEFRKENAGKGGLPMIAVSHDKMSMKPESMLLCELLIQFLILILIEQFLIVR